MTARAALFLALAAGFAALRPSVASADSDPSRGTDVRRSGLVQVYVAGSPEAIARTRIAVQELLSRLELPAVVRDAAGADEELLRGDRSVAMVNAYVDLRSLDAPRVIVAAGDTGEELERRTLPAAATLETTVEAASHVLYMTVESILRAREDAATAAPTRPRVAAAAPPEEVLVQAPPQSPSPAPPEQDAGLAEAQTDRVDPGTASFGASAGVHAAGVSFAPDRWLAGLGASVEIAARGGTVHPGLLGSFTVYPPGGVAGASAAGSVEGLGARLMPYVEWRAAEVLSLYVAAGGGLDAVRFSPEGAPEGTRALGPVTSSDVIFATQLGLKLRATRALAVTAGGGLDVDLSPRRYVVADGAAVSPVFELSATRPLAFLGLSVTFAGRSPFGVAR